MELRIAIVEDQKFEAQRLERLLRQTWEDPVVCDLYESGDAFLHRAAAGPLPPLRRWSSSWRRRRTFLSATGACC